MFQLMSDGSCDLSPEQRAEAGIEIVPYYVSLDGKNYLKEEFELGIHEFFEFCVNHPDVYPRTSMPSVQDYMDAFERQLRQGKDVLCYCLSEKFSGSFSSAGTAAAMLAEAYPARQIRVVDSTLATALQGLLLLELARYAREGHTLEETYRRGEVIKKNAAIYFTIENFSYLTHGGRIGKLMELAAVSTGMRPVIRLGQGELYPVGLRRGRKNAFTKVVQVMESAIKKQALNLEDYTFAMGWGYSREEGEPFYRQMREMFQRVLGRAPEFIMAQIGATIGVYTGPHPIGVGFIEKA